jgi:hypothetical protein
VIIVPDGVIPDEDELEALARMSRPERTRVTAEEPPVNTAALTTNMLVRLPDRSWQLRKLAAAVPKGPSKTRPKPKAPETLKEKRDRLRREVDELERKHGKK